MPNYHEGAQYAQFMILRCIFGGLQKVFKLVPTARTSWKWRVEMLSHLFDVRLHFQQKLPTLKQTLNHSVLKFEDV